MITRRDLFRSAAAAGFAYALPTAFSRSALAQVPRASFTLANGLRAHCAVTTSPYISAALTLRSKQIMGPGGLGHILEHTSFSGAAGTLTAAQVKEWHKTILHDSNATTAPGIIQWQASFLPRHVDAALQLFALTSLDQKFDVETVASEAQVVLQELYLEKYDGERTIKRRIDGTLYGSEHPYAVDTTEAEIAKARTPPAKLAEELRAYAETIRLPANMDLFLVGKLDVAQVEKLAAQAFAPYPFGQGPFLDIPNVGVTRAHHVFKGTSQNLKRPLSELRIAWNTGVRVLDPEATVLVALSHYMDDLITIELREKKGDVYTPEVSYEPDRYSGVFKIKAVSSKDPSLIEARILSTIEKLKTNIDVGDLERFKDKLELGRIKAGEGNDSILKCMVERVVEGGSVEDCDIGAVTPQQIQDAARKYLPSYNGAYVRAVLGGSVAAGHRRSARTDPVREERSLRLSVLDQSVAVFDRPQSEAIRNTMALARACEGWGYHRFWVSEHHANATIVGTAPEILIAAIAATTKTIRVGSAGVMLPHYSSFKVAEQFRVLDAIAPGRIDLGLGRAPGSDGRTAFALNPLANERPAQFPNDVRDLMAWVTGGELPEGHQFRTIKAYPQGDTAPEVWMLGSSDYGAQVAAHFGLPYAFAWFFTEGFGAAQALELYRRLYQPSPRHPTPHAALCVWALAADTEEEAQHHFTPRARFRLLRDRGIFAPLESPEAAAAHDYAPADAARIAELRKSSFVGTGAQVAGRIRDLAKQMDVQEMAVVTWAYDEAARHTSYRLLAEAMG